jgi:hypothetical protein
MLSETGWDFKTKKNNSIAFSKNYIENSNRKIYSGVKNLSLKAFVTTDTELIAMAPPAIIGFKVGPPKIYSKPAATGIPTTL